jgi:FtsP/CotA-like multicopper oxidase with cupredoxin domain
MLRLYPRLGALLLSLVLATTLASRARAATVTLAPSKDNTLYQPIAGEVSNGAGSGFFCGRTNSSDVVRRGLIVFNIAGNIPAGSTINSVTLTLNLSKSKKNTFDVTLHRVLADWGAAGSVGAGEQGQGAAALTGDATWVHRFYPSTSWTVAGGDYAATASATSSVTSTNGLKSWSSSGMVADVQYWLNNPSSNFGWLIKGDETVVRSSRRFDSMENGTVANRPQLVITYTPSQVAGACCLPDQTCSVLTASQCSAQGGTYQGDNTTCSPNPCIIPTGACCFNDGTCQDLTQAQCGSAGGSYQGDGTLCTPDLCPVILTPFVDALPRPGVAVPVSGTSGGTASYVMPMTEQSQRLHRDLPPTRVWGYAGTYPGPTIEAGVDHPVTVAWVNDLRDSLGNLRVAHYLPVDTCLAGPDSAGAAPRTVTHLHGGHVPPEADGYPEATILPGQQTTYVYPNHQIPATLWYHDHAMGITRLNVIMGLAGFYLLRDTLETRLALPSGEFEIPLAIQDRSFHSDGSLMYHATWEDHFFGDKILVNGKVWPYLNVKQGKYRFRMLNGSNSRVYQLSLSSGAPLWVIGTDGGLLPAPVAVDSLLMVPGERYDVVIDFGGYPAGTEILLTNSAPAPYPGPPGVGVVPNVMKFIVQGISGYTTALPATLRPLEAIDPAMAMATRDFVLRKQSGTCAGSIWTINGLLWEDITEHPVLGSTEIWRFVNDSGVVHPMHMHLVQFQILDRQAFTIVGGTVVPVGSPFPPRPEEAGWKDTAPVKPGEMLRVIARFTDYTGKYPYHCHVLEHEDHEMMRQFEVVEPIGVAANQRRLGLVLAPNRPNPFSSVTTFLFELPEVREVNLEVYDISGRRVRTLVASTKMEAREHSVTWDGRDTSGQLVPAGIYFVHLAAGHEKATRKMVIVR